MTTIDPAKSKEPPVSVPPTSAMQPARASAPPAAAVHVLARWLTTNTSSVGKHSLHLMTEMAGARTAVLNDVRDVVRSHYVSPEVATRWLVELGAPKTAQLFREFLPTTKTARSGDIGEVLATETAEQILKFTVPIRRLRWKDGRNVALRGDDIVGIRLDTKGKLDFLKGESKSRAVLTPGVLEEAGATLDRDRGRPTRHAVLFVAARLRALGDDALAARLESAVLDSFAGSRVEHLLLALTGGDPTSLLNQHLTAAGTKKRLRHAVGVRIVDHGTFIDTLFGGI